MLNNNKNGNNKESGSNNIPSNVYAMNDNNNKKTSETTSVSSIISFIFSIPHQFSLFLLSLLVVVVASVVFNVIVPHCPDGMNQFLPMRGYCYGYFNHNGNWKQAKEFCEVSCVHAVNRALQKFTLPTSVLFLPSQYYVSHIYWEGSH